MYPSLIEILVDVLGYGGTKAVLNRIAPSMVSAVGRKKLLTYAALDALYVYGMRGSTFYADYLGAAASSPEIASNDDEMRKAMTIVIGFLLLDAMDGKGLSGKEVIDDIISVGASSIVNTTLDRNFPKLSGK